MELFYYIFGVFVFLLGLAFGSFVNALIYRLHEEMSMWDRSECPNCHHKLGVFDLIPIFSFIFLKRRCRYCQHKISWQYPLVEFTTGIIFSIIFIRFVAGNNIIDCSVISIFNLFISYLFSVILIIIFIYDLKYYLILNKVITAGAIIGIINIIINFIYNRSLELIINYLLSIAIVFGFFLVLYLISRGKWIGAGDVKFGILLGLILPWPNSLVMLFFSYIIGAIVGIILITLKKKKLKEEVPMGTFLVVGTFVTIFWGEIILEWYLGLIL